MVLYGSGTYGSTAAGRISAALAAAQELKYRTTGLQVEVQDNNVNDWINIWGLDPNFSEPQYKTVTDPTLQEYWSYRGKASAAKVGSNIKRARCGDGSVGNRQLYVETSSGAVSGWGNWSVFDSNANYAVAVAENGDIYHARSDGLYLNNSQVWAKAGIIEIHLVNGSNVAMWISVVAADPVELAPYRKIDLWYTPDIGSSAPAEDFSNYRWYRNGIDGVLLSDGRVLRVQIAPIGQDPRNRNTGDVISASMVANLATNVAEAPRLVRQFTGQLSALRIFTAGDFHYLFYNEATPASLPTLEWQRSKDGFSWSEATSTGFYAFPAGVIELGSWVVLCGYDSVYVRLVAQDTYDISDYVPELDFELPRENQGGGGSVLIANPAGVNDDLVNLEARKVVIKPGLKVAGGGYEFLQMGEFWIQRATREIEGAVNRITLTLGDVWDRVSQDLRDSYNFKGQLRWSDLGDGRRNQAFNYHFTKGEPIIRDNKLEATGLTLFTGWRGHNCQASVRFEGPLGVRRLLYRYINPSNYYAAEYTNEKMILVRLRNGTRVELAESAAGKNSTPRISVDVRWGLHKISLNGLLLITHQEVVPGTKPGYIGFDVPAPPTVTGVSPNRGPAAGGTLVTITGSGFLVDAVVTFSDVAATEVKLVSSTKITAKTPAKASTGPEYADVKVTNTNGSFGIFEKSFRYAETTWTQPTQDKATDIAYKVHDFVLTDYEAPLKSIDLIRFALALADYHDAVIGEAENEELEVSWGPQTDIPTPADALRKLLEQYKLYLTWRGGYIHVGKFLDTSIVKTIEDRVISSAEDNEAPKQLNVVMVDGNTHSWIERDNEDIRRRGHQVTKYFDLPELMTLEAVQTRAREELRRSKQGSSPGGETTLYFDLTTMDCVTWIDNTGESKNVRIEGIRVRIKQDRTPSQRAEYDTSLL